MHPLRHRLFVVALALLSMATSGAYAYNASGQRWRTSPVTMHLQLGSANGTLIDGNTAWGPVAEDALAVWNGVITNFQFNVVRDSTAAKADGNRLNNVFFSPTIYGDAWGSRVLGITLISFNPTTSTHTETDVLFNSNVGWNSYRGNLRIASGTTFLNDFRRVALHEFGHALGLDHPDDIGQTVTAVMNATISNIDTVTTDDINGAKSIYDGGATVTAPAITTQPAGRTATVGSATTFSVVATGTAPLSYQWFKNSAALSGATSASYTLSSVTTSDAGNYTVTVTNAAGSVTSSAATLTVSTAVTAPTISTQPVSQTASSGASVTFSVTATGSTPLFYQWRKDGTAISGATSSSYTLSSVTTASAGSYTVVVSNSAGSLTSTAATLTITPAGPTSRLSNLSVLTTLAARQILTVGLTMTGGSKQVLIRAVGPGLATLGVPGTMPDPQLTLYANGVKNDANDDWLGANAGIMSSVGAFPLSVGSFDAALVKSITGGNTVEVTGSAIAASPATNAGTVIVELYDTGSATSPRLTNISALNLVSSSNLLTAGFTLAGSGKKRLLVRAIGPGLTPLGVGGVLADPKLDIFNAAGVRIDTNDTWDPALAATFSSVGAFALPAASKDAALIVELDASSSGTGYTVQVSGPAGTSGVAIVELYELP